jgi:hypothetical protein
VTYGITNRAQISAAVPFYRASYDGFSQSGLDKSMSPNSFVDLVMGALAFALGAGAEITGAGVRGPFTRTLGGGARGGPVCIAPAVGRRVRLRRRKPEPFRRVVR